MSDAPSKTRTCRCERLKSKVLHQAGTADIPWIWDNETTRLMQSAKRRAFFFDCGHDFFSLLRPSSALKSGVTLNAWCPPPPVL
jgi:hypothetical protein